MRANIYFNRPMIMGILNVTPDSFSDAARYVDIDQAVAHGLAMAKQGADIIDVGGESTRPGSASVEADEQKRRVLAVIACLKAKLPEDVSISIDTMLSEVAQAALDTGASIINDISAGRHDPEILALAADRGVTLAVMHMQGTPQTMQNNPLYDDVVAEVEAFLIERARVAEAAGVPRDRIILDPGIGFGKTREHNLSLLACLNRFVRLKYPILLGASRKRFMGALCDVKMPEELIPATCATTALGVMASVSIFRVHDVAANRQAADVAWAVKNAAMQ
jgi:dihydropteroate synthase